MLLQIITARAYTHEQQAGKQCCAGSKSCRSDLPVRCLSGTEQRQRSCCTCTSFGHSFIHPNAPAEAQATRQLSITHDNFSDVMAADLLVALAATMSQEHYKLLIMDSIMAHLRVDFSGRGELSERQQKLGILMSRLRKV